MQDGRVPIAAISDPTDPLAAVTHPDPYPYYARLAAAAVHREEAIGMWVAASAAAVEEVLHHPQARVRPPGEPVPAHLVGTAAGEVYARLVRMTDGGPTPMVKARLIKLLGGIAPASIETAAAEVRAELDRLHPGRPVERWLDAFPVGVVGRLLGIDTLLLGELVDDARALAACFAPGATAEAAVSGSIAATRLERAAGMAPLVASVFGTTPHDVATANLVGLFFQTFDATAGLIGNVLVGLARQPHPLDIAVERTLHEDPAIHNTRRWFPEPTTIATVTVPAGEPVLVVLAAANHDPGASVEAAFGAGAHRCPAASLVPMIAGLAVDALADHLPGEPVGYRRSPNARIPRWA